MKVALVHNEYAQTGGEEAAVRSLWRLLERHGHEVAPFMRSSSEIPKRFAGRTRAFMSGIYSPGSRKGFAEFLASRRPDVVHVHNLFPLISPSILPECRKAGVPVVMTVHNHRLLCPNGLGMTDGVACDRCSGGREYWCVLKNCEGQILKSMGYALRSFVARKGRFYSGNVAVFAATSHYLRDRLVAEGFCPGRIAVLPHMVEPPAEEVASGGGSHIGFAGRISREKGIQTFLEAARLCPNRLFRVAGDPRQMAGAPVSTLPNVEFLERLEGAELDRFYSSCLALVVPSICHEAFGLSAVEAMVRGKPVICTRTGGLSEVVEEGATGLFFEMDDPKDLAAKIEHLCDRPDLRAEMGRRGREKAQRLYSAETFYEGLMKVYDRARREKRLSRP